MVRGGSRMTPLLRPVRAPRASPGRRGSGRQEMPSARRSGRDPRLDLPREGESRRGNQGAFRLRETSAPATRRGQLRLPSTPRHAVPLGRGDLAIEGARLWYRFVRRCRPLTRQAPETARRADGGPELSLPNPRPVAAPPKVSTTDSARAAASVPSCFFTTVRFTNAKGWCLIAGSTVP
jgi:hypothetical protein